MIAGAHRYLAAPSAVLSTALMLSACQANIGAREALEAANLEKAIYCMEVLEVDLDLESAARDCFSDTYIQHSQHVPDGKEGTLAYFASRFEEFPDMTIDIKRAGADGDLVWMHLHFIGTPDSRGNAAVNIFRMEDGKFAEHWGVGQPVPEESVHGNSMF